MHTCAQTRAFLSMQETAETGVESGENYVS